MKICLAYCLLAILVCGSCKKQTSSEVTEPIEAVSLDAFLGDWTMLTEQQGEYVVFRPCDADNTTVQLQADTLVIGWGQDASAGVVTYAVLQEDGRFSLTLMGLDGETLHPVFVQVDPKKRELTRWWLWNDGSSALFVRAEQASGYPYIEQPCQECWEDCPEE